MSLSLMDSASFARGFSPSPSFEVTLVMSSTSCWLVIADPSSVAFCLSCSLAAIVGLHTLGSRLDSSRGGCRTGKDGSTGGAFDPAGVVENKLCSLSLAWSAKSNIVSRGLGSTPAVVVCSALGVAYTSAGPPSSSWPSSSMFNIRAEYLLSFSISSSTLSCNWALSAAAWLSCLFIPPSVRSLLHFRLCWNVPFLPVRRKLCHLLPSCIPSPS